MSNLHQISILLNAKSKTLPINKKELEETIEIIFHQLLFPICDIDCTPSIKHIYSVYSVLLENVSSLLNPEDAEKIVNSFLEKLPDIKNKLYQEAHCYVENDPAANSVEEIILTYPGFYALSIHRISHALYKLGVPIIPRLFSEYAHSKVGIDIHPGAKIGDNFYIDHGTGIVIGGTSIIGNNVKIYQGVTLGAVFVSKELKNTKRHPTIENNVVIYAGATILGGTTTIGHDSTIGGNVWLTKSVVPYSLVFNTSEVRIKNTCESEVFNFTI